MGSPFEREDGEILVAVERANGGELAPLEQVLWTLDSITPPGSHPDPVRFVDSATVLVEFGMVEYFEGQLGLTVEGRRLLRRSGLRNDSRHVAHVTDLLQQFDELDTEQRQDAAKLPAPTIEDVHRALNDAEEIEETPGGIGTPVLGEEVGFGGPWGVFGSAWVPAVPPQGGPEQCEPPPQPIAHEEAPSHHVLSRLFGRPRRDRG